MNDFFKEFDAASSKFHHAHHQAHHQAHQRAHQHAHQQAHQSFFGFDFGSLFDDDDGGFETNVNNAGENHMDFGDLFGGFGGGFGSNDIHIHKTGFSQHTSQQTCRTVTKREGNTVSTITECH
jgi:hypothetical protein